MFSFIFTLEKRAKNHAVLFALFSYILNTLRLAYRTLEILLPGNPVVSQWVLAHRWGQQPSQSKFLCPTYVKTPLEGSNKTGLWGCGWINFYQEIIKRRKCGVLHCTVSGRLKRYIGHFIVCLKVVVFFKRNLLDWCVFSYHKKFPSTHKGLYLEREQVRAVHMTLTETFLHLSAK